jgi:serine/threonine protein kinase
MEGGSFIASGSYGCAFKTPVKCTSNADKKKSYYEDTIGKVFNRVEHAEEEKVFQTLIKKLDPKGEWTIQLVKSCAVSKFSREDKSKKCTHVDKSTRSYPQLIYEYGGIDLYALRRKYANSSAATKRNLFIKLFKCLLPVFHGLSNMSEHGWIHLDIKPQNILFNGSKLFVIDFGLMTRKEDLYKRENLHLLMYQYPYYPAEFRAYGLSVKTLNLEKLQVSTHQNLAYYHMSLTEKDNINKEVERFFYTLKGRTLRNMSNKNISEEYEKSKFWKKVDIYSLGITLYELYITLVMEETATTHMIREFISHLINCNPYERMDWPVLIREYEHILNLIENFSKSGKK